MTVVKFLADKNNLYGFEISGHSSADCEDEIGKTVCAAVSSAAYLTANTVTDIIGDEAIADISDAFMRFSVKNPSESTVKLLEGLRLHLSELAVQYHNNINIHGGAKQC